MIACSRCQSDNVQKLSMAYESGISDVNTKTKGFSLGGGGLNFGGAKTKGTSQTALSKRTAPPRKYSYVWPFIFGLLSAFITDVFLPTPPFVTKIVFVGVVGGLLFRSISFNRNQWPSLYKIWSNSFICGKCGEIFEVGEIA